MPDPIPGTPAPIRPGQCDLFGAAGRHSGCGGWGSLWTRRTNSGVSFIKAIAANHAGEVTLPVQVIHPLGGPEVCLILELYAAD